MLTKRHRKNSWLPPGIKPLLSGHSFHNPINIPKHFIRRIGQINLQYLLVVFRVSVASSKVLFLSKENVDMQRTCSTYSLMLLSP